MAVAINKTSRSLQLRKAGGHQSSAAQSVPVRAYAGHQPDRHVHLSVLPESGSGRLPVATADPQKLSVLAVVNGANRALRPRVVGDAGLVVKPPETRRIGGGPGV